MILANSVGVMGAQLELRDVMPDGTQGEPRSVDAIVLTCGLGSQGEIQVAIPGEIANEIAEQMRLMNSNIVKAQAMPDTPPPGTNGTKLL